MKHRLFLFFLLCFCFVFLSSPTDGLTGPADENSPAYEMQRAAGRGDIQALRKLLQQKNRFEDFDYDSGKILAFLEAAKYGHHAILRLLLQQGVDVNAVDDGVDMTALGAAAMAGRLDTMRILLNYGADVNLRPDPGGTTALMHATEAGQVKAMRLLLAHGAKVSPYNDRGHTALMYAAEHGSLAGVQLLLKHKADINQHPSEQEYGNFTDTMAWSPLMFAAYGGHLPMVQLLVKNGAKVQVKGNGTTAFILACKQKHIAVAKFLASQGVKMDTKGGEGETALLLAAEVGALNVVQWLLEQGVDVNAQPPSDVNDYALRTALMQASMRGHTDIVKVLLKYKADMSKKDQKKQNCPHAGPRRRPYRNCDFIRCQ